MWLNFGKGEMLPITLQTLSTYVNRTQRLRNQIDQAQGDRAFEDLAVLQAVLIQAVQRQTNVRCKYPLRRQDRIGLQMSSEQLEYHQQEMRTGKPHPGSPCPDRSAVISKGSSANAFDLLQQQRITLIATEIEIFTGITLQRSADGCPFIGSEPMPAK